MPFVRRSVDAYKAWPKWARIAAPVTVGFLAIGALGGGASADKHKADGRVASETTSTTSAATTSSTSASTTTTAAPTATTATTATTAPPATTTTLKPTTTSLKPTTTTVVPAPAASTGMGVLAGLREAAEPPRAGYDRSLFEHWVDADGNRCDTREEVLIAESQTLAQVDPYGCKVVAGDWFSIYDGLSTEQPGDLDIDHVVALAEAWDSGASGWDDARRRDFANDLGYPGSLVAVSSHSNQVKSDQDPAEWLPPRREAWCGFATDWVAVKVRWDLSADPAEISALRSVLGACPAPVGPAPPEVPSTTSTTAPAPTIDSAVRVSALDCGGERVTISNSGATTVGLAGWTVHDEGTKHTYSFPAGLSLAPGGSVTVRSGGPAGPGELAWTGASVWNNDGDTAYLVDASGQTRSTRTC